MENVHPTWEEAYSILEHLAATTAFVREETLGETPGGRPLKVGVITDAEVDDSEKSVAVVTAGQHGAEEGGRAVGMAVMEWLVSPETTNLRRKQVTHVFPCVNPDGASKNEQGNSEGVNVSSDYRELKSAEARMVWEYVEKLKPEACVDLHGLAGGGMNERVLLPVVRTCNEDVYNHFAMAREMVVAAERTGFPQAAAFALSRWKATDCIVQRCYDEFGSCGFLMEVKEGHLDEEGCRASGIARARAFLSRGNRHGFHHYYVGYPCDLVSGTNVCGLFAGGKTPEERRESRVRLLAHLDDMSFKRTPDEEGRATMVANLEKDLEGQFAFQLRFHLSSHIRGVEWDEKGLGQSEYAGVAIWEGANSKYVRANLPFGMSAGEHRLAIRYDP